MGVEKIDIVDMLDLPIDIGVSTAKATQGHVQPLSVTKTFVGQKDFQRGLQMTTENEAKMLQKSVWGESWGTSARSLRETKIDD